MEELNQSLRQRDKGKDDAIAQLSDQLVSLSARLQEIERRQDVGTREFMLLARNIVDCNGARRAVRNTVIIIILKEL